MVGTRQAAWLTALLALGFALLLASTLPGAGALESRGAGLVAPVSAAIEDAASPLADAVHHLGRVQDLTDENAALRAQIARLEADLASIREQELQASQLADLVAAVGTAEAARYLPAAVLLHDPAPARDNLTIDRGERDGVRTGQPVLGPGATLVGVVTGVEATRARVRLLSDPDSAIAVVVQSSRTQAALAGAPEGLRLELVPVAAQIAVGDVVLSSTLGGRLPGGLLVGRVSSAQQGRQELFAEVAVEPLADYARLEQVLVLTDHDPTLAEASR